MSAELMEVQRKAKANGAVNHYRVLGLQQTALPTEVKASYRCGAGHCAKLLCSVARPVFPGRSFRMNNWLKGCVSHAGSWHSSITQTRPPLMLRNLAQALCSSSSQKQTPLCLTQTKGSNMMHHCLGGSIGLLDTQHIGSSRVIENGSNNALHGTSVQW